MTAPQAAIGATTLIVPKRESPEVRQSAEAVAKTREQPDLDAGLPDAAERERRDHRGRKRAELGEDGDGLHGEAAREEPAEEVAAAPADAGAESEQGRSHGGLELPAHTNMRESKPRASYGAATVCETPRFSCSMISSRI
jgi:hypothetical protein